MDDSIFNRKMNMDPIHVIYCSALNGFLASGKYSKDDFDSLIKDSYQLAIKSQQYITSQKLTLFKSISNMIKPQGEGFFKKIFNG